MHRRLAVFPALAVAGLAITAVVGSPATAAPAAPTESAVPAEEGNGWKLHLTFPQTSQGLAACFANVNYYTNNPQYPEVKKNECRNGPGRYEHWWYIDA